MISRTSTTIITLLLGLISAQSDDKLAFVFEMVRHGARAPLIPQPPNVFKVAGGCLTASGMRQRFLLGAYYRQRYIEQYGLLDETFNPNQIYSQATDVHRVL
jgi:hypothetical protein